MYVLRAAILLLVAWAAVTPLGAAPEERTISINLRNADVRQVIAYVLRGTDINYVFADDVSGRITCGLFDLPVEQALQAILSAAECEGVEEDGALFIRKRTPPPEPAPEKSSPATTAPAADTPNPPPAGAQAPENAAPAADEASGGAQEHAPSVYYIIMPVAPSSCRLFTGRLWGPAACLRLPTTRSGFLRPTSPAEPVRQMAMGSLSQMLVRARSFHLQVPGLTSIEGAGALRAPPSAAMHRPPARVSAGLSYPKKAVGPSPESRRQVDPAERLQAGALPKRGRSTVVLVRARHSSESMPSTRFQ